METTRTFNVNYAYNIMCLQNVLEDAELKLIKEKSLTLLNIRGHFYVV